MTLTVSHLDLPTLFSSGQCFRMHPVENGAFLVLSGEQALRVTPLGGGRYAPFENKTLLKIAAVHGKAVSQVMLRWNVQRGVVVIPKSTHRERIVQNLDIWDFSLTEEEMGQISALDLGYAGTAVKHFDPDFVRMCVTRKIHD